MFVPTTDNECREVVGEEESEEEVHMPVGAVGRQGPGLLVGSGPFTPVPHRRPLLGTGATGLPPTGPVVLPQALDGLGR